MKKLFALLIAAALILSLAACASSGVDTSGGGESAATESAHAEESTAADANEPAVADVSGWNWVKDELDCYGYDDHGDLCYLSYEYPDNFKTASENHSGEQYRGYYFNPNDADATANNSPYGVYIYFVQGGYSATRATLEEDIEGGFEERELGGRTVLFGELAPDPYTGAHCFAYYIPYDEDEWARIWMILSDPEADGAFRKTFEESMNFTK